MLQHFNSEEQEEAILHILINFPDKYFSLSSLKSYMFSNIPRIRIFEFIEQSHANQTPINFHILIQSIAYQNDEENVGGNEYLEKLKNLKEINPDNIRDYEKIVVDAWKSRKIIQVCIDAPARVKSVAEVQSVISYIRRELDNLDKGSTDDSVSSVGDLVEDIWEDLKNKHEAPGISGISTGLAGLDRLTGGKNSGDFWVIAGRPGMGKTAMICNMVLDDAKQNKKAMLFSLEMNKQLLIERMLSISTGIPLYPNIRMGDLDEEELNTIRDALNLFKIYPIFLDTNFIASLEYLETMIRKYKHFHDIDVFYIDYIQILAEREADQTHAIGRITRKCKLLAEELGIAVIAASQLNRNVEARQDKRPILNDLRQSGNIEEDGDIVLGLYRDKKYNIKTPDPRLMECIILKQRNGPTDTVLLDFKEETNKIRDKEGIHDGKQAKEKGEQVGETARAAVKSGVGEFFQ